MLSSAISDWFRLVGSSVVADACLKASVLLAVTAVAAFLLRRASAAVRHRLWCLAFGGVLLLPVLSLTLPQWRVPLLPAVDVAAPRSAASDDPRAGTRVVDATGADVPLIRSVRRNESTTSVHSANNTPSDPALALPGSIDHASLTGPPALSLADESPEAASAGFATVATGVWLVGVWLLGAIVVTLPFALGVVANLWLLLRSRRVHETAWTRMVVELAGKLGLARPVTLLETHEPVVPMTWGVMRPVVLLPSESHAWNDERRRFVLLHELAHVKRLDVLFQSIARLACALYWFNPLAWYALWRLRVERELACDDCVVAAGERPSDYASQLLAIARAYRPARFSVGVAMASSTKLEQRIIAILDRARSHLPVGTRLARVLLAAACAVVLGLSVVGLGERDTTSARENTAAEADGPERKTIRGRVVNESGEPIAAASVYTIHTTQERNTWMMQHEVVARAKTDKTGAFEVDVPAHEAVSLGREYLRTHSSFLLATADGFGPDAFLEADKAGPDDEIRLRLVRDTVPLEGRVLDLEGRPLAGVRLQVRAIRTTDSDLAAWVGKAESNPKSIPDDFRLSSEVRQKVLYFPAQKSIRVEGLSLFPAVTTDADGRFRIDGLGPDRHVVIDVTSPAIARDWISAVTREMPTVPLPTGDPRYRTERCFGASFDYTAEPTQALTGIVRDLDSQEPLAGTVVEVLQFGGSLLNVRRFVRATTDAEGRYRLVGLPKQPDGARPIRLLVVPAASQPYFRTDVTLSGKAEGLAPVNFDIELKRASWVSGRLVDEQTGAPLTGYVSYYPFIANANAGDYANFNAGLTSVGHDEWYRTAADGSYRVPAVAGRGVIVARAANAPNFRIGVGAGKIGWKATPRKKLIYHLHGPEVTNAVHEVNVNGETKGQDISLVPLSRQRIRLLDEHGKPLTGVRVGGHRPMSALNETDTFHRAEPREGTSVDVLGLTTDGRRLLLFSQNDRKLGKVLIADEDTDTVTLQPYATFSGRLVDARGKSLEGLYVNAVIPKSESPPPKDNRAWGHRAHYLAGASTDADGRFHFDYILPGAKYEIRANGQSLATHDKVEAGQVADFGDLKVATVEDDEQANVEATRLREPIAAEENQTQPEPAKPRLAARVLDPLGNPVAGASVYVKRPFFEQWKIVATSDDSGNAEAAIDTDVELNTETLATETIRFAAVAKGWGFNWFDVEGAKLGGNNEVRLKEDVAIEGRIVNAEGQPLSDVAIGIRTICQPTSRTLDQYIEAARGNSTPFRRWRDNWWSWGVPGLKPTRTDAQGRFRISGIGAERLVELSTLGNGAHYWNLYVATRMPPADAENASGAIRLAKPPMSDHYFAKFTHVNPASRTLRGTVLDQLTGEPIENVLLVADMATWDNATTDASGRFSLRGARKAGRYRIQAKAPAGGYFHRWVYVTDTPGVEPLDATIKMVRGITIRGKVTDKSSGAPVQGKVEYHPVFPNKFVSRLGNVAQPCSSSEIAKDGSYELQVLPGPGALGVRNYNAEYTMSTINMERVDEILDGAKVQGNSPEFLATAFGGQARGLIGRQMYKAITLIKPEDGTKELTQDIFLLRGKELPGIVVGPGGEVLKNVRAFGLRHSGSLASEEVTEGRFTVRALSDAEQRTLIFYLADKKLGAVAKVKANRQGELRIRMQPCGSVHGRLVDADGRPLGQKTVSLGQAEPRLVLGGNTWQSQTDQDGRFQVDGLVPGLAYVASVDGGHSIAFRVRVKSGQKRDVGQVQAGSDPFNAGVSKPAVEPVAASSSEKENAAESTSGSRRRVG